MQYDPVKKKIGYFVRRNIILRKLFYKLLGMIFLREWYVKKRIRELYKTHSPEKILDAGSGFGQYSFFLAKLFPKSKILLADVKEDQIDDCRFFFTKSGFNNCEFTILDLTKLQEENIYDFILTVDVMEHIEDDTGVFRNFNRALKKDGVVLINTPSDKGGSDVHDEEDESFISEHVRNGYSKDDICTKLNSAGFDILHFEYTYGKWGNKYWRLAIKYPIQLVNKSQIFILFLPFYYFFTIWFAWLFMYLDIHEENKEEGTGILVIGKKI